MGLTGESTGSGVLCGGCGLQIVKETPEDKIIALAGNPNVGKSTVFNALTGLNQHTGNWPGKTVANAQGKYRFRGRNYILVDIPGTYSLMANSAEEEVARDFVCFGEPDATVVVADATCLERNLNLVVQAMEITDRVVLCVNLLDEAAKKKIHIDFAKLSESLGIPVVGASARSGQGLDRLMDAVHGLTEKESGGRPMRVVYDETVETAIAMAEPAVAAALRRGISARWVALKLIDGDESLLHSLRRYLGCDISEQDDVAQRVREARAFLAENGIPHDRLRDRVVTKIVQTCEQVCRAAVRCEKKEYNARDRGLDRILTSKVTGIPIMILLLCAVFWLTITGANYPSDLIAAGLFWVEDRLQDFFAFIAAPAWVSGLLVSGVYKTLAWVVSVMLPPMAIFFPLFTLLEDSGYLPRIAFNMDNFFRKACAHGKQALTMCMGFIIMHHYRSKTPGLHKRGRANIFLRIFC
jgi:ferrous iron transport protein B